MRLSLDGKKFVTKANDVGLASGQTVFYYCESDAVITASYNGGKVTRGTILGKRINEKKITLLYHCLTTEGQLLAGEANGLVVMNDKGRLEIS